jgi:hypothetical protein
MHGGIGPGPGPGSGGPSRNLLELVPGKDKTVDLGDHPLAGILGVLVFALPGSLVLWVLVPECLKSLLNRDFAGAIEAAFGALFGVLFAFPLCLTMYVLIDSRQCLSIVELSLCLDVPEDVIRQLAREKGVAARYCVRNRHVYRRRDFDSLTLLRPSEPAEPSTLLRPGPSGIATQELLLRTASQLPTPIDDGKREGKQ